MESAGYPAVDRNALGLRAEETPGRFTADRRHFLCNRFAAGGKPVRSSSRRSRVVRGDSRPGRRFIPFVLSSGEPEGSSLLEQVRITEITSSQSSLWGGNGEDGEQLFLFDYRFAAAPDKDGLCYFAIYDSDVHVNRSILYRVGEGSLTELAQFNGYIAFTSSNRRGFIGSRI